MYSKSVMKELYDDTQKKKYRVYDMQKRYTEKMITASQEQMQRMALVETKQARN